MTDEEHEMIRRVHDYLFVPPIEGKPSRARQVDELLSVVRAGKLAGRLLLWVAGVAGAIGAIWTSLFGVGK